MVWPYGVFAGFNICIVEFPSGRAIEVRRSSAKRFPGIVRIKREGANTPYVQRFRSVRLGDEGYSYDDYNDDPPRFGGHQLLFRVGSKMFWVGGEGRSVTEPKLLALAKSIVRNARTGVPVPVEPPEQEDAPPPTR
jgi:hypothetical protein